MTLWRRRRLRAWTLRNGADVRLSAGADRRVTLIRAGIRPCGQDAGVAPGGEGVHRLVGRAPSHGPTSTCDRESGTRESHVHSDCTGRRRHPVHQRVLSHGEAAPECSGAASPSHGPRRDPVRTDPGGASPYHPRVTPQSPTGQTVSDQDALTCNFLPALYCCRHPWTVSTTCARSCRVRDPGSGLGRFPARRSGIAGCSSSCRSLGRGSHIPRFRT